MNVFQYTTRLNGYRTQFGGLPSWARMLMFVAALPGIVLAGLSILAFVVSILALLLLTVPVYRLLQAITGVQTTQVSAQQQDNVVVQNPMSDPAANPRRHVDVKIVE